MQRDTDSRQARNSEAAADWLSAAFEQALTRALESMAGAGTLAGVSWCTSPADPSGWGAWRSPVWRRLALETAASAGVWAGCGAETVTALGRLAAGDPTLAEAECQGAYLEMLSQAAAAAGDLIALRLGKRVSFSAPEAAEAAPDTAYAVHIECVVAGATHVIALAPNAALMQSLDAAPDSSPPSSPAASSSGPPQAPPAVRAAAGDPLSSTASQPQPRNMDLLLEVELPVCVTFGRTQLPLKDVLKLSSGSIVELNRLANEPVEVLINDCVIARGEVVVVDGNYGIRVTEIVSRQERIRSIL
ncbi:MAG TPA: flagellar motor switch protein FliN [Bryobacterales bacterium]|nr:flagellar motor switch protein FliN [Bryobacterales bacterium]